jgi:predicted nucleotidyltransferase
MPPLESRLLEALRDLVRGLEISDVRFCIIGALVPQLLLDVAPKQLTKDADAVVLVNSLGDFSSVKLRLEEFRFKPTSRQIRLQHEIGVLVDILPYGHAIVHGGRLELQDGSTFNMAGFDRVFTSSLPVLVENGFSVPVVPVPLYVLLKLVAFSDRRASKDLAGVLHCLRHYEEDSEHRYGGLAHGETLVPFETTTAYLLGADSVKYLGDSVRRTVAVVLDQVSDVDSPLMDAIGREEGRRFLEPEHRQEIVDLFRWFRISAGL